MEIEIFTEDSGTTADKTDAEQVLGFFRGTFLPAKDLATSLGKFGNVTVHILSDEYGYLKGSDPVSELDDEGNQCAASAFADAIQHKSKKANVVIILLTQSTFEEVIDSHWEEIVSGSKIGSIWCLGASRSALSSLDLNDLHSRAQTVITYQRVGVARIGSDCKSRLLSEVEKTVGKSSTED